MRKYALLFYVALFSSAVHAEPSGEAFLKIDPSPRSEALGGTSGTSAVGAQATSANPAQLLGVTETADVFTSFSTFSDEIYLGHAAASWRPRPDWGFGLLVSRLSSGDLERRDSAGSPSGTFTAGDTVAGLSAAKQLGFITTGVTAKMLRSTIDTYSTGWSYTFDVGIISDLKIGSWPVGLSLAGRNIGPSTQFVNEGDPLPTSVQAGAALSLGSWHPRLQLDRYIHDTGVDVGVGLEYELGLLALRIGHHTFGGAKNLAASSTTGGAGALEGFTMGFGLNMSALVLDYALVQPTADLGLGHRVALSFRWGGRGRSTEGRRAGMMKSPSSGT